MLIINPNLAIDRTIHLERLQPGTVIRTGHGESTLGGKGVNVARVARRYGHRAAIFCFLPAQDAARLGELADAEGATLLGVHVDGQARGATILLESSGRVTVLNEPGPRIDATALAALLDEVEVHAPGSKALTCSGSLPPGAPLDTYAQLVRLGRALGLSSVVDATGEPLRLALAAGPDIVSPNLQEAEAVLLGRVGEVVEPSGPDVVERAAGAVEGLVALGARAAIVSAGRHGAAFGNERERWWCPAPTVTTVNPIGAGDALVGGLAHALEEGASFLDAVVFAVAVASASCEDARAGGVDPARAAALAERIRPMRLSCPRPALSEQ